MLFIFFELSSAVLAVSESDIKVNNIENNTNTVEEKIDKGKEVLEEDKEVLEEDKEKEEAKSKIESLKRALEDKLKVDRENKEEKDKKEDSDKQDKNVYTITFESNGGSGKMKSVEVEYGKNYILPKNEFKAPKGKEFSRWIFNEEELLPDDVVKITKDVVLKAVWKDVVSKGAGENVLPKEEALKFSKEVVPEPVQAYPGKNVVGKFQIDEVYTTRMDDPTKESNLEAAYIFNIKMTSTEQVKAGETLTLDGYYPKVLYTETNKEVYWNQFPLSQRGFDEKAITEIKVKKGTEEIIVGKLVGNKIIFNKNAELFDNLQISVGLGIASRNEFNVEKEGRQELYEVPFYVVINGKVLPNPYMQKIKPANRVNLKSTNLNHAKGRIFRLPTEDHNGYIEKIAVNPYGTMYKLAQNGTWKGAKIQAKIILPDGLKFKKGETAEFNQFINYTSKKTKVLADNHDINIHYNNETGMISAHSEALSDKVVISDITINRKPLEIGEGTYDWNVLGIDAEIVDTSVIDFENKKLEKPIRVDLYLNGKLEDTVYLDLEFFMPTNEAGGTGFLNDRIIKETIKAKMEYEADPTLKFNETKIAKSPVDGEKKIIISPKIVDGERVEERKETIIKQPVNGLTKVGNKKVDEEKLPFKTIEEIDKTLKEGETKIKVKGVDGLKTTTTIYEVNKETGKLINPKKTVTTKDPVDQIVLKGTKPDPIKTSIKAKVKYFGVGGTEEKPEASKYKFVLKDNEGNVVSESTNDGNGNIVFEELNITDKEIGSHKYTVEQIKGDDPAIEYDTHVEDVTVNVSLSDDNKLSAKVTYDQDGVIFTNKSKIILEYPVTGLNHSIYTLTALLTILSIGLYTSRSKSKH